MKTEIAGLAATRRGVLASALGAAASSVIPSSAAAATGLSLKTLAKEKGIYFGSCISARVLRSQTVNEASPMQGARLAEPSLRGAPAAGGATQASARVNLPGGSNKDYQTLLKAECSILVPENELKTYSIMPTPGEYDFESGDLILNFAKKNQMKMRGHTLLWNHPQHLPKWLLEYDFGSNARLGTELWLRGYIDRVCTHFGDAICSWDVINESIDPKTGELRVTPFNQALGKDALRIAFEAAREHAPQAQLVYNDYMSWEADHATHRAGVLKLLEYFRKNGVPVDALGVQSHLVAVHSFTGQQLKDWTDFVNEVVGMGYGLLVTEFDVNDLGLSADPKVRDGQVADVARRYLDLMLSYRQLDQVLAWGLADNQSWLQSQTFLGMNNGKPLRPTPFDSHYRRKPLADAIAVSLRAAPARRPSTFLR